MYVVHVLVISRPHLFVSSLISGPYLPPTLKNREDFSFPVTPLFSFGEILLMRINAVCNLLACYCDK